ncbi:c-type cytochrome biogenesis protein CcmI [Aurantimonas aggregata]|uniref:C-type cytochrome biogenesis protein CcmI n=1 Tax=Aurantimonas aggregata TaxID=2047720 RepID=A0A6L9MIZ0_9HYPH|nr:c-type cytochrome biogenesis protein CcmI [Aurantimonas aggregata]NDV87793.1 c-type cytochrome biogenesis protein CcmI [Aurantimonas aggregata]
MVFWFVAAGMTAAATLIALWPLFADGPRRVASRAEHDVEVYAAQLRELDADVERGTMPAAEAATARAEIGRRLLRADGKARLAVEGGARGWQRRGAMATVVAVVALVPLTSAGLYYLYGAPGLPDLPLASRQGESQTPDPDIGQMVAAAEERLRTEPDDGQGWDVLAPIYLRMERPQEAAEAFRQAIRLLGASAPREAGLGEALTQLADGEVTEEARAAFERSLTINPAFLPARFFLALDLSQEDRYEEAGVAWAQLVEMSPPNAPWMQIANAALADARQNSGAPAPTAEAGAAAPGPTAADVEAASAMEETDRQAMIRGMVGQLAARLETQPNDVEGWKRLIHSYRVLGEDDRASEAYQTASRSFAADSAAGREIAALGAELGLVAEETQP